ncbi:MAG: hypothetical protein ACM3JH_10190 [Acidithiobacillales bacterium]
MKTTVELPDELLIAAKKRAAETRTSLKEILSRGLRRELAQPAQRPSRSRRVRWVTVAGGLPPGLDMSDREAMYRFIRREP